MPQRDPSTGKFVAGGDVEHFDDLEHQTLRRHFSISAGNNDGTTGQFGGQTRTIENAESEKIAGGLSRGEVAELVAVQVKLRAFINSTQTADGTVRGAMELSTDTSPIMLSDAQKTAGDVTANDGTTVDYAAWGDTSPEVLAFLESVSYGPITDGTNGVGGSGTSETIEKVVPYRAWFGSGPTYDRHNDLNEHLLITQWNVADAATHLDYEASLLWDIREE